MSLDFEDLRKLMETGDVDGVVAYFRGVDEKGRRKLVKPVRAYGRGLATVTYQDTHSVPVDGIAGLGEVGREDFQESRELLRVQRAVCCVAGVATLSGAEDVAKWVATTTRAFGRYTLPAAAMIEVLADRAPEWLPLLPDTICDRLGPLDAGALRLVDGLAAAAGVRPRPTDDYVHGWAEHWSDLGIGGAGYKGMRVDRATREFVPRLFAFDAGDGFFAVDPDHRGPDHRGHVFVRLLGAGVLDRQAMLEGSLARMLRGGRIGPMRTHLDFWASMEPSGADIAANAGSCISLLASDNGSIAGRLAEDLRRSSDEGLLGVEPAVEAAARLVLRPERKLARAAIAWIDVLVRRYPDRVGELLVVASRAFGSQHADVQEHALTVVAQHEGRAESDVVELLLAEARLLLPADLADRAATLLGDG